MKSDHNTQAYSKKNSVDSAKSPNQVIEDEPIGTATEDQLISLLHLDNISGLRGLMKRELLDYNTLERYIYCDIIPGENVSTNSNNESELEDNPNC
jgi:hypothetical protein